MKTDVDTMPDLYAFDIEKRTLYGVVCGADEAGRGPLAGDVYAAAVILDECNPINGINDSKKLSAKKRELLYDEIVAKAKAFSIASASVEEIETLNILNAAMLAMKRAMQGLDCPFDCALIDGNKCPDAPFNMLSVVHGDALSASIAAASILAKVARDRYMLKMAELYPQYCFEKHKGYGTKLHYQMLEKYGICPIHRKSFLKKLAK